MKEWYVVGELKDEGLIYLMTIKEENFAKVKMDFGRILEGP